jgi:hypothetical protein
MSTNWGDNGIKITVYATPKFNKVRMQIADEEPVECSLKTALFEIRRRHYHLGNVAIIDYNGQPYNRDNMTPQGAHVADTLIGSVPDPLMHKKATRHLTT